MGEMLLNGRLYGASGIRELTQAQYDALPASKLTDGVLYCIKDTGIVEGEKFAPIIYSLEEREIGVWTDGKPLYEKVFISNSVMQATTQIDISNLDVAFGYVEKCYMKSSVGSTPMPDNNDSTIYIVFDSYIRLTTSQTYATNRGANGYVCVFRYTKTTDIPGSGTWGTDGVPMVHYDGTERIIGTWFGETLYEKTIDCGYLLNNAMKDVSVDISNLGIIYKISGIMVTDRVSANVPYLGTWNTGTPDDEVGCYYTSGILRIKTRTDRTAYRCYITLQYTKTS